jgi:hypothetical protein
MHWVDHWFRSRLFHALSLLRWHELAILPGKAASENGVTSTVVTSVVEWVRVAPVLPRLPRDSAHTPACGITPMDGAQALPDAHQRPVRIACAKSSHPAPRPKIAPSPHCVEYRRRHLRGGQSMKGNVRLCDLSPSGMMLLYFAEQFHPRDVEGVAWAL